MIDSGQVTNSERERVSPDFYYSERSNRSRSKRSKRYQDDRKDNEREQNQEKNEIPEISQYDSYLEKPEIIDNPKIRPATSSSQPNTFIQKMTTKINDQKLPIGIFGAIILVAGTVTIAAVLSEKNHNQSGASSKFDFEFYADKLGGHEFGFSETGIGIDQSGGVCPSSHSGLTAKYDELFLRGSGGGGGRSYAGYLSRVR